MSKRKNVNIKVSKDFKEDDGRPSSEIMRQEANDDP